MDSHGHNGADPSTSSSSLNGGAALKNKWIQIANHKPIAPDKFKRMKGEDVNLEWLKHDEDAFKEPIVVEEPEGLGMEMPGWKNGKKFGVEDVTELVGGDTPVEVIDTITQSACPGWTLSRWTEYYKTPASERDKIRNVISLEVSGTPLGNQIAPPRLVKQIDWVEQVWPANKRGKGQYPKVQLYCLMSVAECWTDMHIDFAGSSVFYHVLKGSKVFYFIRPTKSNLDAYEKWSGSELQEGTWLGDMVNEVVKVELKEGNTMFIPTGWIHAVYTPADSLVFGGNFLHSYNIATQLRVRQIEINTKVPKKFRFPFFQKLCWYIAEKYNRDLKAKEEFPPRVLEGLRSLADFLVSEARLLEGRGNGNENLRREAKEHVPGDKVKDAPALAREFRWRVRLLLDGESGDEVPKAKNADRSRNGTPSYAKNTKRRRVARSGSTPEEEEHGEGTMAKRSKRDGMFKNFEPKTWDMVRTSDTNAGHGTVHTIDGVKPPKEWELGERHNEEGTLEKEEFEVVRLRRLDEGGYEREKVIRIRETWRPSSN
ncbi:JmjC domain-containing histone demethylation protein 1 [Tulasnella sp. 419]|nr:JmjC domain-containing histone demethylation protein 1 [Tulasnella sp. 419]